MDYIENRTFDEIKVGDSARLARTLTSEDINIFRGDLGRRQPDARGRALRPALPLGQVGRS